MGIVPRQQESVSNSSMAHRELLTANKVKSGVESMR
jgi:hypothetical protein